MPEYLAPGVYVEEVSFRAKSIEGVGTSTCAFVGPTAGGPVGGTPELLTSFADYERIYGGMADLNFGTDAVQNRNYMAHAVRAFYNNGGARLYVVRVAVAGAAAAHAQATPVLAAAGGGGGGAGAPQAWFVARFPGAALNGARVIAQQTAAPVGKPGLANAPDGSVARVHAAGAGGGAATATLWHKVAGVWKRRAAGGALEDVPSASPDAPGEAFMLGVDVALRTADGAETRYEGLGSGKTHPRAITTVLAEKPERRADQLGNAIALHLEAGVNPAADELLTGLVGAQPTTKPAGADSYVEPSRSYALASGGDGTLPARADYEKGFEMLVGLEDVSIVAAPGHSAQARSAYLGIQDALLAHVANPRRYRMAVLDAPPAKTPTEMRELRGLVDTTRAALYYPWVTVNNPLANPGNNQPVEIDLPPSGFVCGIYARNDVERGVHKAPANEVVRGALRFERTVNHGEQELLNPIGVNCLRYLSGRGFRVWGARTVSSDPEWKYLSVRRYFNYLEASIDRGTQWAVFEPNGELLWANIRSTISDFLYNEWRNGALLGTKVEEAFFVRCDRTTMTQNDLDNGRLICLIGVAVVKPAEFVIFRIGQKTADAKS